MKNRLIRSQHCLLALIIGVLLASAAFAQNDTVKLSVDDELKDDLALAPCKNTDRLEAVKRLFTKMGATDVTVDELKDVQNVEVTKKGKTDETVIVSAHYDKVPDGCGAIDNWTGIVMIANLYHSLRNTETQKTYLFVAFDKEELGLVGSAAMVKSIPKEKRASYCAVVNLDSFGFSFPQALTNASSNSMLKAAKEVAAEMKVSYSSASFDNAGADSSSFKDKSIPAITFHGMNSDWQHYLHTSNDKLSNIDLASVSLGYRFVSQFLAKIESSDCSAFR